MYGKVQTGKLLSTYFLYFETESISDHFIEACVHDTYIYLLFVLVHEAELDVRIVTEHISREHPIVLQNIFTLTLAGTFTKTRKTLLHAKGSHMNKDFAFHQSIYGVDRPNDFVLGQLPPSFSKGQDRAFMRRRSCVRVNLTGSESWLKQNASVRIAA